MAEFHDIDPSLAPFALANERLALTDQLSKLPLSKVGAPPGRSQMAEKNPVLFRKK